MSALASIALAILLPVVAITQPDPQTGAALAAAPQGEGDCESFKPGVGGSLISVAFSVDPGRHVVISPPQCTRGEELLWIHPLRLNPDEYLILQKCTSADCSKALLRLPWAREALEAATARGPTPIERSGERDSAYVATFQGGSSVWMRAMRTQDRSPAS